MSKLPYFLDYRLTESGEVISLTRRPPYTTRKFPGTHLCWRLSRSQGHNSARRFGSIEKCSALIGNGTHVLPTWRIVPQPTTLPRAPDIKPYNLFIILWNVNPLLGYATEVTQPVSKHKPVNKISSQMRWRHATVLEYGSYATCRGDVTRQQE
jgi:hypothetical protein